MRYQLHGGLTNDQIIVSVPESLLVRVCKVYSVTDAELIADLDILLWLSLLAYSTHACGRTAKNTEIASLLPGAQVLSITSLEREDVG